MDVPLPFALSRALINCVSSAWVVSGGSTAARGSDDGPSWSGARPTYPLNLPNLDLLVGVCRLSHLRNGWLAAGLKGGGAMFIAKSGDLDKQRLDKEYMKETVPPKTAGKTLLACGECRLESRYLEQQS